MSVPITFLSDYGYDDNFAGVCRAVIGRIAPDSGIVDIGHGVPRQDVRRGAIQLATALPYTLPGVHLAVVDPGVGSGRLPIALRTAGDDRFLVGPDNGLLMPAAQVFGGVESAVDLSESTYRLEPVSATFHGRDIFAPVAAYLANGFALAEVGTEIDPASLATTDVPAAVIEAGRITAHVLTTDTFGNVVLNIGAEHLQAAGLSGVDRLVLTAGGAEHVVPLGTTFADVGEGELVIYLDSNSALSLAANRASAAAALGLEPDAEVVLAPAGT